MDITKHSTRNMSLQIRLKQLATKSSQDKLREAIVKSLEETECSGEELIKILSDNISNSLELIKSLNASFSPKEQLENIGYPIKFNKTALQLKMALDWIEQREIGIINDLTQNNLYNNLSNDIDPSSLPILQSPNNTSFWGNENSSVSSVLLYSIASTLGVPIEHKNLVGAATFYPFFKEGYTVNGIKNNPFVFEDGMLLFGDYQFGGHRYFSNYPNLSSSILRPEDCSSSVGKAHSFSDELIKGINTTSLRNAYTDPANIYGCTPVTSSSSDQQLLYDLIEPGDIYLRGGHTAIIAEKNNSGVIKALEFNRDIDVDTNKRLGGGTYEYNLTDMSTNPVYILRVSEAILKEACHLSYLLETIDNKYYQFDDISTIDPNIIGNCDSFFDIDI